MNLSANENQIKQRSTKKYIRNKIQYSVIRKVSKVLSKISS